MLARKKDKDSMVNLLKNRSGRSLVSSFVIITSFVFLVLLSFLAREEFDLMIVVAVSVISLLCLFLVSTSYSDDYIKSNSFVEEFYLILHSLLIIGRYKRRCEINEFIEVQFLEQDNKDSSSFKINPVVDLSTIDFLIKSPEDISKMFNRREISFNTFIKELIKDYSKNSKDDLYAFYLWIHCIPRHYSLDTTKDLIKSNRLNSKKLDYIVNTVNKMGQDSLNIGCDRIFINYNEKQIKRLFSVNCLPEEYIFSLFILKNFKNGVPKVDTLKEFNNFVKNNSKALSSNIYNLEQIKKLPKLQRIESSKLGNFKFKVLENTDDLHFWGTKLKHCIKAYYKKCSKGNCVLIGVYLNDIPYANIEVVNEKVTQLFGKQNSNIDEHELIKDYIENFLKI
jgi:hypothetical protein